MSGTSLKGLCTLFSSISTSRPVFEKATKGTFVEDVAIIQKALEQSDKPKYNALAKRLEVASNTTYANDNYFIYPIRSSENDAKNNSYSAIYIRQSTLKDLQSTLKELCASCIDTLKTDIAGEQRDRIWDILQASSRIICSDTPKQSKTTALQASGHQNSQEVSYKPL